MPTRREPLQDNLDAQDFPTSWLQRFPMPNQIKSIDLITANMAVFEVTSIIPQIGLCLILASLFLVLNRRLVSFILEQWQAGVWLINPQRRRGDNLPQHTKHDAYRGSEKPCSDAELVQPLNDFDWTVQQPQKFRPFKSIYHITMGKWRAQIIQTHH